MNVSSTVEGDNEPSLWPTLQKIVEVRSNNGLEDVHKPDLHVPTGCYLI